MTIRRIFLALSLGFLFAGACAAQPNPTSTRPRLAVVVVFDQLRADFLTKWRKAYCKDGFQRLMKEGAWFQNCHYPYANTMTAAGHASMMTGCSPDKHGVVANSWYDRQSSAVVNAVQTPRYPLIPLIGEDKRGAAPKRLLRPTIGDALMKQSDEKGKVVSISIKDRAAIMLAGLLRGLVLWFDRANGHWVTSTYYRDALPRWVTKSNKSREFDRWFKRKWIRLRSDLKYDALTGPDNFRYEGNGVLQGLTFPHPMTGGEKKVGGQYWNALANSPFGNDMVLTLAKRAIVEEKLGTDDVPDLLCVSFSSNDYIGHCWGPDSHEVLDVTLRSDLIVRELMLFLDAKVGKGNYVLALCADHGVSPLPEMSRTKGIKSAGRLDPDTLSIDADKHLDKTFGKNTTWIERSSSGMIYLHKDNLKKAGVTQAKAEAELARWLTAKKGIRAVYTRSQITAGTIAPGDVLGQQVIRSFHPASSGDVMPVLEPYWLLSQPLLPGKTGAYVTTHGTPHSYDTHVPLLIYGPNITPGVRRDRIAPQAIAGILAQSLGVNAPPDAQAPPKGLFAK